MKPSPRVLLYLSLAISPVVGGLLSGCYSSKEVEHVVPAPAPVVQVVPAPVPVAPATVVEVPPSTAVAGPIVVASPESSQTTTTRWSNGTVQESKTKTVDGLVQRQTTTTWNDADTPSQTTTTTTTDQ